MTDNRALWELVENWRARYAKELKKTTRRPFDAVEYKICANELAEILERPVVVGDDVMDRCVEAYELAAADYCDRDGLRAALESMVRGKS